MVAYYNEIDPYAAQWLRNLILQGHLPRGDVDERSITEVSADDLRPYSQCHFFAGIGGWPLALRIAGWDDDRPVWTGSCPCQPFSAAGKQKGKDDERHLWPVWFRLIRERKPSVIFGEQVASAIAFGWLDETAHDLEAESYAFASAVLPACSVGAPHRRDRLWFVADAHHAEWWSDVARRNDADGNSTGRIEENGNASERGASTLEHPESIGRREGWAEPEFWSGRSTSSFTSISGCDVADSNAERKPQSKGLIGKLRGRAGNSGDERSNVAYSAGSRPFSAPLTAIHSGEEGAGTRDVESERHDSVSLGDAIKPGLEGLAGNEQDSDGWSHSHGSASASDTRWLECPDGKTRTVKSGIRLLANGVPSRVAKLRAGGNAIVPEVAAAFIKAYDGVAV